MAKKRQTKTKKTVKKVKVDEDLVRKVDSLVDEIERTNNFKKITDEDIEELEATLSTKKIDSIEEKTEILDVVDEEEIRGKAKEIKEEKKSTSKKYTKKDLNKTNSYEFKFDEERLRELDSLDTSFLEGRINNNTKTKKKKAKKVNDALPIDIKDVDERSNKFKVIFLVILLVFAILLVGLGSIIQVNNMGQEKSNETKQETKKDTKKENPVESHYLFVGDFFTLEYDIENSFSGYHLAVSGSEELTSTELLENLRKYVYNYNPSKVIIQIGINDLLKNEDEQTIENNIRSIIKEIKENRPYAEIYIESLYPINDSDAEKIKYSLVKNLYNNQIEKINSSIKNICKDNSVTFIDVYTVLFDKEDNMLNIDYTLDGLSLSEKGYKVVTRKIFEVISRD